MGIPRVTFGFGGRVPLIPLELTPVLSNVSDSLLAGTVRGSKDRARGGHGTQQKRGKSGR